MSEETLLNEVANEDTASVYDVIVAGGGISGVLAAARLAIAHPEKNILLLEKDPQLGGRLRGTSSSGRSYGLNAVSEQLFEFWRQTACFEPGDPGGSHDEGADGNTSCFVERQLSRFGVLAGNRLNSVAIDQWFTPKGARALGGLTAAREWGEIESILNMHRAGASKASASEDDESEGDDDANTDDAKAKTGHPFSHFWKKPRKAPAAVVIEHFGSAFGIPDIWGASPEAVAARAAFHASRLRCGNWDDALRALTEKAWFKERVTVLTGCMIANASFAEGIWTVEAEAGAVQGRALIVAQSPWAAINWLPRSFWPSNLLSIPSKTKPVSVVVLSERLLHTDVDIPDVVIVPSERVQIIRSSEHDIAFQATIDFELSLQAPAVVKAVRSLKRARKKLQLLYPDAVSETNHIALQPVAWAQSPSQADKRWVQRANRKNFNTASLAFCGDAYGESYDGDANIIKSLMAAVESVAQ